MPKIDIQLDLLDHLCQTQHTHEELSSILSCAKAEWHSIDENILKIECTDTNRPDLWSTVGISRFISSYQEKKLFTYPFFQQVANKQITVHPQMQNIRPYIFSFRAYGRLINKAILSEFLLMQEKLSENFGHDRKSLAIGIYSAQNIQFPLHYCPYTAKEKTFVPLGETKAYSLEDILHITPKGKEYAHLLHHFTHYPILEDAQKNVLSFPPILNSEHLGKVCVGMDDIFIEATGTYFFNTLLAISILACNLYDLGFEIEKINTQYSYDTPLGKEISSPTYFQNPLSFPINKIKHIIGIELPDTQLLHYGQQMGFLTHIENQQIQVHPAAYRNDFLHPVDVIEDFLIAHGLNKLTHQNLESFSIGKLSPAEILGRKIKDIMIGLGFQEMIYNYLGSYTELVNDYPSPENKWILKITNPISEQYAYLRTSILPSLLRTEKESEHFLYPHKTFEISDIAYQNPNNEQLIYQEKKLAFLVSDCQSNFNTIRSVLSGIFYYLNKENNYSLVSGTHASFIPGRTAHIIYNGEEMGVIGELHPQILSQWNITMPSVACEISLKLLIEL